jgi:hypothetical protein
MRLPVSQHQQRNVTLAAAAGLLQPCAMLELRRDDVQPSA